MMKFCPKCKTERPVVELTCEGSIEDARCGWNLFDAPWRPPGWRPLEVVPAQAPLGTQEARTPYAVTPQLCLNGHPVGDGDQMCGTCDADLAPISAPTPIAAAPSDSLTASGSGGGEEAHHQETVINGWRVLRQIQSPLGLRDQYLVESEAQQRPAVLTVYHTGIEPDTAVYEAIRHLPGDHVMHLLDTGRWNERAFEVMEETTEGTLADIGIAVTEFATVRHVVQELGKALDAMAQVGLRHRDLRPGALLVRARDPLDLVISGFGAARLSQSDLDIEAPLQVTRYTAPEAIAGGVSPASDWWSLGMILLEQVTSGTCFEGVNDSAFLIHVLATGAPIPPDLPPELDLLFRGLLARNRHERWRWEHVRNWLEGKPVTAPAADQGSGFADSGPAITLAGVKHTTLGGYALAAADSTHWAQAKDQLIRGEIIHWASQLDASAETLAGLRKVAGAEDVDEDSRLLLALKILNRDMPLVWQGALVTPKWLLDHPAEGYALVTGPVPDLLHQMGFDTWLIRLKERVERVRTRAAGRGITLDEDTLRIYLLSTSRARLSAEWEERRKFFPDSDHNGVLTLLQSRAIAEVDLIVLLSANLGQFKTVETIVGEASALAREHRVTYFNAERAGLTLKSPHHEIMQMVAKPLERFSRCDIELINQWADNFRQERRMPLARALVLLSVPPAHWVEPHRQEYLAQLLTFFERKIVASVMRGPLVRMQIGKTTARVDLSELGTARLSAESLLDHLLMRNPNAVHLDPVAFDEPASTTEARLLRISRDAQLYKRDTGIDGLYLGFPFLLARSPGATTKTRIAPLLLWPVRLTHQLGARGSTALAFDKEREDVRINPAIEGILGREQAKRWWDEAEKMLGRSALRAADVVDQFGHLATMVRSRSLQRIPSPQVADKVGVNRVELECAAALFLVTFAGQAIGEDLRNMKQRSPTATALETTLRLMPASAQHLPPEPPEAVAEEDRYLTIESDPSQEEVVLHARRGPGLVIEGPPGTGKSQTIVNLVGDAIGQQRTLLIVCQKRPALEVVYKRLAKEKLEHRVLMINDAYKDRDPILRAIRDQVAALHERTGDPAGHIHRRRQELAARIEALENALDRHHHTIHLVHERIGLSYRSLLGKLMHLEYPTPPLDVPALRMVLEKLNTANLATIEEELGPLARFWLPARYEDSPLAVLKPFDNDAATIGEFTSSFLAYEQAEDNRATILLQDFVFDVDDPVPHQLWLKAYAREFLDLSDMARTLLTRWLSLFRKPNDDGEPPGQSLIAVLRELLETLKGCNDTHFDPSLSPALCAVPVPELAQLHALATEAAAPAKFWQRMNPFRALRVSKAKAYLNQQGQIPELARLQSLANSTALELKWRPVRTRLLTIHQQLHLPEISPQDGPMLAATANTTLTSLNQIAALCLHICESPSAKRVEQAVLRTTKEAMLQLIASYDRAFARYEARRLSREALRKLSIWMEPNWVDACRTFVQQNVPGLDSVRPIAQCMPTLASYQRYRHRAEQLSRLGQIVFRQLREKQDELDRIAPDSLDRETRRVLQREAHLAWKRVMEQDAPDLQLEHTELESKIASLAELDHQMRQLNGQLLREHFDMKAIAKPNAWQGIHKLTGKHALRLREFIEQGASLGLMKLRPIWLMNPDVASRVLPLAPKLFDTVVFDEASQMPVEFSVPSLYRAASSVISGDEKQMPPSAFFSTKVESDGAAEVSEEMPDEDAPEDVQEAFEQTWSSREIMDCPDLLLLGRTCLPVKRLQVHYRSAYRELIGFSNAAFYDGDLSIPVRHSEATLRQARPIEYVRVDGVYHEQTNADEAHRVVQILGEIWKQPYTQRPSVGVVTFNRKQADLIEELLELQADRDSVFAEAYRLENERTDDGEDRAVFVKNVENVQGDERDIIIFSSTFGRNKQGSFYRTFGVLGQAGGERRLNVAVTRARRKIIIVTSMPTAEISDVLTTRGELRTPRDHLQGYWEYAKLISDGQFDAARSLLSHWTRAKSSVTVPNPSAEHDDFRRAVLGFVESLGHNAKPTAENDAFGVDFAVEHPETGLFAIGIECDAPRHHLLKRARAREVWRRQILDKALPHVHRISCRGWYHDPNGERQRLRHAIERAIQLEVSA